MNIDMLKSVLMRLSRKEGAVILWCVERQYDINQTISFIRELGFEFEHNKSQSTVRFGNNNKIIFMGTAGNNGERLCGLLLDEVIIDENA